MGDTESITKEQLPRFLARLEPYDYIRSAVGLLLLTTAALKAWQVVFDPASYVRQTGIFSSKWVGIGIIEAELFLAGCLLLNVLRRTTWAATLFVFCGFSAYSAFLVISGADSCGCYGSLALHPAWSLVIDVAVVVMLSRWRPSTQRSVLSANASTARGGHVVRVGGTFALTRAAFVTFSLGLIGGALVLKAPGVVSSPDASRAASGEIVMLDPHEWIGGPLPVAEYTSIGPRLAKGNWVVVFYQAHCSKCEAILAELGSLNPRIVRADWRVAAIEVPVDGATTAVRKSLDGDWEWDRLDEAQRWIARTPVVVVVQNGVVRFGRSNVANLEDVLRQAGYFVESGLE